MSPEANFPDLPVDGHFTYQLSETLGQVCFDLQHNLCAETQVEGVVIFLKDRPIQPDAEPLPHADVDPAAPIVQAEPVRILPEAISNAVPVHTLEPDDLQKLDHRLDYLLMRTADHLAAAGHDSPLDGTKELLWTKIRDFTSADLARVKRRRMERAAAPDTVSWH